jgi:hypothetical protein
MGLLSKLFGGRVDKNELIKKLVRLRIRSDPMAAAMGFSEQMVDSLSGYQLACLPEATIITIVETWSMLHKKGVSDTEIFSRIEDHRSTMFPRGQLPSPLNLANYIKYRLDSEHTEGALIQELFIESAIDVARKAYAA